MRLFFYLSDSDFARLSAEARTMGFRKTEAYARQILEKHIGASAPLQPTDLPNFITPREFEVLEALEAGPQTVAQICAAKNRAVTTMSPIAKGLSERLLIKAAGRVATGGRLARSYVITDVGRSYLNESREQTRKHNEAIEEARKRAAIESTKAHPDPTGDWVFDPSLPPHELAYLYALKSRYGWRENFGKEAFLALNYHRTAAELGAVEWENETAAIRKGEPPFAEQFFEATGKG